MYSQSQLRVNLIKNSGSACWKTPLCKSLEQLGQPVAFDSVLPFLLDNTSKWFPTEAPQNSMWKLKFYFLSFSHCFEALCIAFFQKFLSLKIWISLQLEVFFFLLTFCWSVFIYALFRARTSLIKLSTLTFYIKLYSVDLGIKFNCTHISG